MGWRGSQEQWADFFIDEREGAFDSEEVKNCEGLVEGEIAGLHQGQEKVAQVPRVEVVRDIWLLEQDLEVDEILILELLSGEVVEDLLASGEVIDVLENERCIEVFGLDGIRLGGNGRLEEDGFELWFRAVEDVLV